MKTRYIYQIKLKDIQEPQVVIFKTEVFEFAGKDIEWWRLIGKVESKDDIS